MDFDYREEEMAVAELARKILEDQATNERLKSLEAAGTPLDAALYQALADSNLLGTAIPEAHGGSELGFLALCLLLQEVGRTVAPVPAYAALTLGAWPLARFGSDAQKQGWLPEIASGERIVTAALTELDSSDPLVLTTRATADGEGLRITGTKSHVPCGAQASHVLVPARTDDGDVVLAYVEIGSPGVRVEAQGTSDGLPYVCLELVEAPVGAEARLATEGVDALRWIVEHATVARCMMQLGVTERALEMTAAYSRERVQFDRPIGSFQAVHQRAADAYIQVEAQRLTAQEAAWRLSEGMPGGEHVPVAKYWAAEGAQFAAYACQHLHGGIGIDCDYPLHRYFKWAIHLEHELGSARHQLDGLGRDIAANGLPPA